MSVRYLSSGLWPLTTDGTDVTLASGQLIWTGGDIGLESSGAAGNMLEVTNGASGLGRLRAAAIGSGFGSDVYANYGSTTTWASASGVTLSWDSSTNAAAATTDTYIGRAAAANLRLGAAAANPPVAQTLSTQPASGTDVAGANFTVDVSPGTGTGLGGSYIVRTAAAGGSSGSSQNAQAAALTIDSAKLSTFTGDIRVPSTGTVGASGGGRWLFRVASDSAYGLYSDLTGTAFTGTSGAMRHIEVVSSFTPASGSGSYAMLHLNPTPNGTSSGTAYGLIVASKTNTLTGGTIKLASFGTTTTDGFTGYTQEAAVTQGTAITVGSGAGLTVNEPSVLRRVIHKVTVTYAALAAAATTADKTIATLPAKSRLVGIVADTTTPYTGGAVTAATLIVGKSVGGNEYVVSHDVLTAAIVKGNADADLGTSINRANAVQGGDLPSWTGTTAVSVRLTTTTANTDQLTAGSTTYYLTTEVQP